MKRADVPPAACLAVAPQPSSRRRRTCRLLSPVFLLSFTSWLPATVPADHVRAGNAAHARGRHTEALDHYRRATAARPAWGVALLDEGIALYDLGRFGDAEDRFSRAARLLTDASQRADAFYNLGNALVRLNRLPDAADAYRESLKFRPRDADALFNLDWVLRQQQLQREKTPAAKPKSSSNRQRADLQNLVQRALDADRRGRVATRRTRIDTDRPAKDW